MRVWWLLLIVIPLVYSAYEVLQLYSRIQTGRGITANARPFTTNDARLTRSILVLGDSTAVGVGATNPAESVAGRLSDALTARVENYAESGASTADILRQLASARETSYDVVILHVGANDVMSARSLAQSEQYLRDVLQKAQTYSPRVVVLTAGNIGEAPFFPPLLGWIVSHRTRELRERFMRVAHDANVLYIDLYAKGNLFGADSERYYASDGLHLSGDGYKKWFDIIYADIERVYPDLVSHPHSS